MQNALLQQNNNDSYRALVAAANALRQLTTEKAAGLQAEVSCCSFAAEPDPVRRQRSWQPVYFIECASVSCLQYRLGASKKDLLLKLRFHPLITRGYCQPPLPTAPHHYSISWPPYPTDMEDDDSAAWIHQSFPRVTVRMDIEASSALTLYDITAEPPATLVNRQYSIKWYVLYSLFRQNL